MDTVNAGGRRLEFELEQDGGRWSWSLYEAGEMIASGMWLDDRIECLKNLAAYLNGLSGEAASPENERQICYSLISKGVRAA